MNPDRPLPSFEGPSWLFLQLVDGAFPSGGFAHSGGLEAACRLGGLSSIEPFVEQSLTNVASTLLPFVGRTCADPEALAEADARCEAMLVGHVARRASRAQGRALATTAGRIFDDRPEIARIAAHAQRAPAHHAPVFGAIFGALGMSPRAARTAYLHGALRSMLSAGVRLGLLGPLEAQQIHARSSERLDALLARHEATPLDDVASTAPILELFGALHDELDARLFQS